LPTIRPERPDEVAAVHRVNAEAFGQPNEADLVDALRANGKAVLSLVAELDGQVVGHVLFSPMSVEPAGACRAVGLAPLAVLPERQRQGIGSALVRDGIERCRNLGFDIVLLLGEPEYYSRFGFINAAGLGIDGGFKSQRALQAFQVLELRPMASPGPLRVAYAEEFAVYT
jgi:putative acetyltransferase